MVPPLGQAKAADTNSMIPDAEDQEVRPACDALERVPAHFAVGR
jgi:hypothetical protein